jgi:aspartyl aminopeptidase
VNTDGLKLNSETHLPPILATAVKAQLEGPTGSRPEAVADAPATARHHPALVLALAMELGVEPGAIHDFDLSLYDTQPSAIGGIHDEFIFSGRLDNLMMTYTTMTGLLNSAAASSPVSAVAGHDGKSSPISDDPNIRIAAAFDHEEVGSDSISGAGSTFLQDTITRLCGDASKLPSAIRKSVLVSADMAHAVHPNYSDKHAENLRPEMHKGIVIKSNANQRYATTPITSFVFRQIAAEAGVPIQWFTNRQDMGCGSTIGPIVATRLGIRTVDVGLPQLSMHSIREVCGTDDTAHAVTFFSYFYGRFATFDASMEHAD